MACKHLRVLSLMRTYCEELNNLFVKNEFPDMDELHITGSCPINGWKKISYPGFAEACPNLTKLSCSPCCGRGRKIKEYKNLTYLRMAVLCGEKTEDYLWLMQIKSPIKELHVESHNTNLIFGAFGLILSPYSQIETLYVNSSFYESLDHLFQRHLKVGNKYSLFKI